MVAHLFFITCAQRCGKHKAAGNLQAQYKPKTPQKQMATRADMDPEGNSSDLCDPGTGAEQGARRRQCGEIPSFSAEAASRNAAAQEF